MTVSPETQSVRIERTYATTPEHVWRLWTTGAGIESSWSPDGFTVEVNKLDPRPGGELSYTMTATAPEQIAFMHRAGLPLSTESRKTFVEVDEPARLSYTAVRRLVAGRDDRGHRRGHPAGRELVAAGVHGLGGVVPAGPAGAVVVPGICGGGGRGGAGGPRARAVVGGRAVADVLGAGRQRRAAAAGVAGRGTDPVAGRQGGAGPARRHAIRISRDAGWL
ncbi:SRPBCC family protein [Nonomuraea fuscirosea]|uniref:SRPBCC family protein n=1 Tax=Nonomuraea fuscirosea TaxID=1291556 RepID=UPI003415688E